ncbi:MAG: hypothetical protein ACRD51_04865 [Candidatus Acidiferrum sp.]
MDKAEDKNKGFLDRLEEKRLSTADLAGAVRDDARKVPIEGEIVGVQAVEIVDVPREEVRKPIRPEAAAPAYPVASAYPASQPEPSRGAVAGTAAAPAREPLAAEEISGPLFSAEEAGKLREQWDKIQVGFVDEPRSSVELADSLVAAAMKRLAEQFAAERSKLEGQWDRGGDVSTEDLRLALRRYRSFFGRLLSV